ncbi:MAG: hypothetical protein ACK4IY_01925 [Chitinophagales bacterium]
MGLRFLIQVSAQFIHRETQEPLSGDTYLCRLYDADILEDDLLGTSIPDAEGRVHYSIDPKYFRDFDSFLEKLPDLFIEIEKDGAVLFKTPIAKNIQIKDVGDFDFSKGEALNLGTFFL